MLNQIYQRERVNMVLNDAEIGVPYTIIDIQTDDIELNAFMRRLGCYSGQSVVVISRNRRGCVASILNNRYSLDADIASSIII